MCSGGRDTEGIVTGWAADPQLGTPLQHTCACGRTETREGCLAGGRGGKEGGTPVAGGFQAVQLGPQCNQLVVPVAHAVPQRRNLPQHRHHPLPPGAIWHAIVEGGRAPSLTATSPPPHLIRHLHQAERRLGDVTRGVRHTAGGVTSATGTDAPPSPAPTYPHRPSSGAPAGSCRAVGCGAPGPPSSLASTHLYPAEPLKQGHSRCTLSGRPCSEGRATALATDRDRTRAMLRQKQKAGSTVRGGQAPLALSQMGA